MIKNYELLDPEDEQVRQCLNCEINFVSTSKYNRICKKCKEQPYWHEDCEDH